MASFSPPEDGDSLQDASSSSSDSESETSSNHNETDSDSVEPVSAYVEEENMSPRSNVPTESHLRALARKGHEQYGNQNTHKDYKDLYDEYCEFSLNVYGNDRMTLEQMFNWLSYQAHRPKRDHFDLVEKKDKQGNVMRDTDGQPLMKKKRRPKFKFSMEEYKSIMDHLKERNPEEKEETTGNRLQSLEKHWSALMRYAPDHLKSKMKDHQGMKDLKQYVSARKKTADSIACVEKVNPQLEKFKYPTLYPLLEKHFWDKHRQRNSWKDIGSSFRDRYTLNSTVQMVVCHETIIKCKLSNFQVLHVHLPDEIDGYSILFRNISVVKNDQADSGKRVVIQAKSIRHKDVTRCEQGSLAIYLFVRYYCTDEDFDLSDNKAWYHIRTAVPVGNSGQGTREKYSEVTRMKNMGSSTYTRQMELAFEALGHKPSHTAHFGRSCAPVLLEFAEVLTSVIKELGNWSLDVFEKHYASKMAWEALRAAAGFRKERGHYYLPRAKIPVPQDLKDLVFPNVVRCRNLFHQLPDKVQYVLETARHFIEVMDHLATVFMQDCCVLLSIPERAGHNLFSHPFFSEPLFLEYQSSFNTAYEQLLLPENDPTFEPVKRCLPLIGNHLSGLHVQTARHHEILTQLSSQVGLLTNNQYLVWESQQKVHECISSIGSGNMHLNHVMDAAMAAHNNSPYRPGRGARNTTELGEDSVPAQVSPLAICHAETVANETVTTEEETVVDQETPAFPPVPTTYDSFEAMLSDWYGRVGSPFAPFGGISNIDVRGHPFRAQLSPSAKKVVQRLAFVASYIKFNSEDSNVSEAEIVKRLVTLYTTHKKNDITLYGSEQVLRKYCGWNGKKK